MTNDQGKAARSTTLVNGVLRRLVWPWRRAEGAIDLRRLRSREPFFPTGEDIASAWAALERPYQRYINEVSPANMAASLQTNAILLALCRKSTAKSCLDLGSGFSSYVLRQWAKEGGATVASVDDDSEWLARTQAFVNQYQLPSGQFYLWPDLPSEKFEVVFHDFANGKKREETMPIALDRTSRFLILDDAQHAGHLLAMRAVCSTAGVSLYSLRSLTMDKFKRYAVIATR